MADPLPTISPNVIEALLEIYNANEEWLLRVLSTSPGTSVVRANPCHPDFVNAEQQIQQHVDTQPHTSTSYHVARHPLLHDVVVISPNRNMKCGNLIRYEKEVIVDTNCGSAVLRGADVFAPGVLAAHPCMQPNDVVSVYVDLEGKCRRGLVKKFEGKKYFVGNGVAAYSRAHLFENNNKVAGTGVCMHACRSQHPTFSNLDTSLFFPQNLPSAVVGHVLACCEGDFVLDMCAAPGGKTTHVASLMGNSGHVVAIDKSQNKVDRIAANCRNLGLTNVNAYAYDSTVLLSGNSVVPHDADCVDGGIGPPPFPPQFFDKILLDPPCSGLGQRPQLRYVATTKELNSYPPLQKKLLKQAVALLKPGGCLVYSTCTLLPKENEAQVAWVLENYPQLQLAPQSPVLGRHGLPGFGLSDTDCEKVQRFDWCFLPPSHPSKHQVGSSGDGDPCADTIGFFIAKLIKRKVTSDLPLDTASVEDDPQ